MKNPVMTVLLLGATLVYAPDAWAQRDQEASLFAGFSYARASIDDAESGDAIGGEIDYTYFLDRRFGFTLSAAGHWGTLDAPDNPLQLDRFDYRQATFLAGPHVVLWRGLTSEAGIRGLAGVASRTLDAEIFGTDLGTETKFAWGGSINFDWRITDSFWIRLPQASIIFTKFDNDESWRSDYRIAAGFVILAGELLQ